MYCVCVFTFGVGTDAVGTVMENPLYTNLRWVSLSAQSDLAHKTTDRFVKCNGIPGCSEFGTVYYVW